MGLLERAAALDELGGWLGEVRAGSGRVVLVGGEAGIGKTSLVDEFAVRQPAGVRVLWSGCDAFSTPRALGPLVDVAPALGGRVEELLRTQAPREELFASLLDHFRSGVHVLVVEDLHWADEATLDLLRFLARRIGGVRVLIVGTYRDDEVGAADPLRLLLGDLAAAGTLRRLALGPLSRRAVAALVGGSGIDPASVYATTGGNPFYVTEVIAAGARDIPATVRDAVLARGARLSGPARQVLDVAAIVTAPLEIWLLVEVAGAEPGDLDECVAAGMLRPRAGGLEFRHELTRLAIEQAVPPARRVDLHRRTLAALLAGPTHDPARLAHHAEGAGDAAAVLAHAIPAARRAAELGAHRAAAEQYDRALRFATGLPRESVAELLDSHSYECSLTGMFDAATRSRRAALEHWRAAGDRLRQGDCLRWLSRLAWMGGDNTEAERAGLEALELLEDLPPGPELAMAYSNLAQLRMLAWDSSATVHWGQRAIELAERLGRTDILAHALNNVGTAEARVDPPAGRAKQIRGLALARSENLDEHVARAFTNLAASAVMDHDYAEGDRWLREGIDYCAERDLDTWLLYMLAWRARSDLDQGRWADAAGTAEAVLSNSRSSTITRLEALMVIGRVAARRGDAGAWPALDEALALANRTGELQRLGPVAAARAEAAWLHGDPARERALLERAIEVAPDPAAALWPLGELAYWLWRCGGSAAEKAPEPYALQMAGDWAGAAESWRALGCPYEAACALADSDRPDALRQAVTELDALGARQAAALARYQLRELGERVPRGPRPSTKSNPAGLTDREVEVLALVAEGLRNAEIAGRLFLSSKTVGHHVSAIIAKLGVRTRGEAARAAARLGVDLG